MRLFTFRQGDANLVELTLPADVAATPATGSATCRGRRTPRWSRSCATAGSSPRRADDPIEAGDELLFVAAASAEEALQEMLSPHQGHGARS